MEPRNMSTLPVKTHAAETLPPSPWVQRWLGLLPAGATVLDFAAGSGRHAREALRLGLRATAIDRDAAALAALEHGIASRVGDPVAVEWPVGDDCFDTVVVDNVLFL